MKGVQMPSRHHLHIYAAFVPLKRNESMPELFRGFIIFIACSTVHVENEMKIVSEDSFTV